MKLTDDAKVKLFRVYINPFGEDNFRVIRWGGKSKMLTRGLGIDAIRLLQKGYTLKQAKCALGQRYGLEPSKIDLGPLLDTLRKANLIRSVNGRPISRNSGVTPLSLSRFLWRFYLSPCVSALAVRCLPLAASRYVRFWILYLDLRKSMKAKLEDVARNMAMLLSDRRPREISRLRAQYYHHATWNAVDVDMLISQQVETVDSWMNRNITCRGIEHLEDARRRNKGVILCAFHFSSIWFIPAFLIKRGYSVTAMGPTNMGWGMPRTMTVVDRFKRPEYGRLHLIDNFGLQSIREVVRVLRRGEIVLCLAGALPVAAANQEAAGGERQAYYHFPTQDFPRSTVLASLLGQSVSMTAWSGWLSALSGAAVLPTIILRNAGNRLDFTIGAPLDRNRFMVEGMGDGVADHEANAALYRTLEEYVAQYPAQWLAWDNLHRSLLRGIGEPERVRPVEGSRWLLVS